MPTPEEWFKGIPVITRGYFVVAFGTTVLFMLGYVSPMQIAWVPEMVTQKFELWRLMTNFFFFGKFSMGFVFSLYILQHYGGALENDPFPARAKGDPRPGTVADFVWMIIIGASLLLIGTWIGGKTPTVLGPALIFMFVYVWSRKHPDGRRSIYGFEIKAIYLPWVMMAFTMLLGGSPVNDLMGIAVGHVYYFLVAVMPMNEAYGVNLLAMPGFLRSALEVPALLRDGGDNVRGFVPNAGGAERARAAAAAAPGRGGFANAGPGHRLG